MSVHRGRGHKAASAVILGLVVVALTAAIVDAAANNSEMPSNAGDEQFEQDSDSFSRFAPAPVDPEVPQVRLRGSGELKSIGIDYTPESRCSDNNWSTANPTACNPQLSFTCPSGDPLSLCPKSCQACYDSDLANLKKSLSASTITSYQPNYYILRAARSLDIKVLQGLYNDAIPSLAAPDSATNCVFAGAAIGLCGSRYADAILDGACGTTTPWNPDTFCTGGPYIEPLNIPKGSTGQFLKDHTIIAIQLGNEALGATINGQLVTAQMISTAAQTLRGALDGRGFTKVPIVVSLVLGQEQTFCSDGAPPAGVDFIAAHPYCDFVASVPPSWPQDGSQCWQQVQTLFSTISEKNCGAAHTFIGETGYNTGCPNSMNVPSTTVSAEQKFIEELKKTTCKTDSASGFPTFLFAYSDVCPSTGCAPGCKDAGLPNEGNGYFGIFHTEDYMTEGPVVAKFTAPSLACPSQLRFR